LLAELSRCAASDAMPPGRDVTADARGRRGKAICNKGLASDRQRCNALPFPLRKHLIFQLILSSLRNLAALRVAEMSRVGRPGTHAARGMKSARQSAVIARHVRPRRSQDESHFGWFDVGFWVHGQHTLEGIEKEVAKLARLRVAVTELPG